MTCKAPAYRYIFLLTGLIGCAVSTQTRAYISLEGYFLASQPCEAFQSKNSMSNPGDILVEPSIIYEMLGLNKPNGDYYQIKISDAPVTDARWVAIACGEHVAETDTTDPDPQDPTGNESSDNLLALSWQPAFCELKPRKSECQTLNGGNLPVAATQLSIHGLWAQPRGKEYCGVSEFMRQLDQNKQWGQLPELALGAETRAALNELMPGTASFLQRHEWTKHGTCHLGAGGAEEYFADTIAVTNAINRSGVGQFLAEHVGENISTQAIREQFDSAFGEGAGNRVQFHCQGDGNRVLIQELKINLQGTISADVSVSELLLAAQETTLGCPEGVVDPAGLQ